MLSPAGPQTEDTELQARFAANTAVPVERSRAEIERTLVRYGCTAFVSGWDPAGAMIQFQYKGRNIIVRVPYPPDKPGASTVAQRMIPELPAIQDVPRLKALNR